MKQLLFGLSNAWRTGKVELPMGKPWFLARGGLQPITWEGWVCFYLIITWIIGGGYYVITGRDPLGLPINVPFLGLGSLVLFVVCCLICILKTEFSRRE